MASLWSLPMNLLPPRRKTPRYGTAPRRVFQVHRAWVRKHACSIKGCKGSPIEFAHLRTSANSGVGLKPPDSCGISLCRGHHLRAHARGHVTVAEENGMTLDDLFLIAEEFARRTPDRALREAMRAAAADSTGGA
jgi:hypothetical protein